jgi:hypothetical protein
MNQFHEEFQDIMDERYAAVDVLSALSDPNFQNYLGLCLIAVAPMRVL